MARLRPWSHTKEAKLAIRQSILDGSLAPGTIHSAAALANVLGVSRTPVREALIELAGQGLVRFERNRGVRILALTINDIEEVFDLRRLLEVPAATRAAVNVDEPGLKHLRVAFEGMLQAVSTDDAGEFRRFDRDFHGTILEYAANRRLRDVVLGLRDFMEVRDVSTAGTSAALADVADIHRPVLRAIEHRDSDGAGRAMLAALERTEHLLHKAPVDDRIELSTA